MNVTTTSDLIRKISHELALEFVRQTMVSKAKPEDYANAYAGAYKEIFEKLSKEHAENKIFSL